MANLIANLGANPFSTPTGQKVEQATDASLPTENWALNMEICDLINETDEGPKDAIKAIRKRLQQNMGKNPIVVLHTLTVLETCVKNCGKRFQLLACNKDFIQDLFKLIGPKNDPPAAVQEKVLGLIQSWADAFQGIPELSGVCQVYQDLKQKGIEFPMTDLDAMAPIHTPQRTVPIPKQPALHLPTQLPQPAENPMVMQGSPNVDVPAPSASAASLTQEQLVKLRSELNVVEGNMKVFGEMLTELTPGQEHPQDLELLQELHQTCFAMQNRIVELIDKVGIEEVTSELLRINDELNNMFLRYDRYEKKRTVTQRRPEPVLPVVQPVQPIEDLNDKPLIDFGDSSENSENDVVAQMSDLNISKPFDKPIVASTSASAPIDSTSINAIADEFDVFAHSRNIPVESSRGSSYADNVNINQVEIGLGTYAQNRGQLNSNDQACISSIDFEKFLEDRAIAAEKSSAVLPERKPASPSVVPPPPARTSESGASNRRQIEKDDAENTLFAL